MDAQKTEQNNSWLRTFSIGFAIISFGITLAILGYFLTNNNKTQPVQKSVAENSETPPLLIKHLGIDFDKDLVFTKERLEFDAIFFDYGFVIPANSIGAQKSNPQPTFIVPLGTPARSLVEWSSS